mmetsp:Transcript_38558/g.79110  ORF Transcript_38558/g.79110 Transcript_38558/m.79110 type:complete len:227 (-) Transcript_38558:940-1620(-)
MKRSVLKRRVLHLARWGRSDGDVGHAAARDDEGAAVSVVRQTDRNPHPHERSAGHGDVGDADLVLGGAAVDHLAGAEVAGSGVGEDLFDQVLLLGHQAPQPQHWKVASDFEAAEEDDDDGDDGGVGVLGDAHPGVGLLVGELGGRPEAVEAPVHDHGRQLLELGDVRREVRQLARAELLDVELEAEGAEEGDEEASLERGEAVGLVVGHCRDVRADAADGVGERGA